MVVVVLRMSKEKGSFVTYYDARPPVDDWNKRIILAHLFAEQNIYLLGGAVLIFGIVIPRARRGGGGYLIKYKPL